MTTVRIAGNAGSNGVVKNIANIMQVAAWVHSVSQHGPAETWSESRESGESAPVREPTTPSL